jgi:hypothetical protein
MPSFFVWSMTISWATVEAESMRPDGENISVSPLLND